MLTTPNLPCCFFKLPAELISQILIHYTSSKDRLEARAACTTFKYHIDNACTKKIHRRYIEQEIHYSLANKAIVDALYSYTLLLINNAPLSYWKTIKALGSIHINKSLKLKLSINALRLFNLSSLLLNVFKSKDENNNTILSTLEFKLFYLPNNTHFNSFKMLFILSILFEKSTQKKAVYDFIFQRNKKFIDSCEVISMELILQHLKATLLFEEKKFPHFSINYIEKLTHLAQKDPRLTQIIEKILLEIALNSKNNEAKKQALRELIKPVYAYKALCSNLDKTRQLLKTHLFEENKEAVLTFFPRNEDYNSCGEKIENLGKVVSNCKPLREVGMEIFANILSQKHYNKEIDFTLNLLHKIARENSELKNYIFSLIKDKASSASPFHLTSFFKTLTKIAKTDAQLKNELILFLTQYLNNNTSTDTSKYDQEISACEYLFSLGLEDVNLKNSITEHLKTIIINPNVPYIWINEAACNCLKAIAISEGSQELTDYFKSLFSLKEPHARKQYLQTIALNCLKNLAIQYENLRENIVIFIRTALEVSTESFNYNELILSTLEEIERMSKKRKRN